MKFRQRVSDVMTRDPVFSTPDATVTSIAQLMADANCGEVPICEEGKVLGILTDRDIACRTVARGKDPGKTLAREVMTILPILVEETALVADAVKVMKTERVRRLPVVDRRGAIVGVISQVDIAAHSSKRQAGELLAVR